MIKYALKCRSGHRFDSWFANAEAFDKLAAVQMVNCAVCGSAEVEKTVMAPSVGAGNQLTAPASPAEQAMAEMRKTIERESEYVGTGFVSEARAIHDGDAPERSIYGEAKIEDARKLVEDGVPVAPLPFMPKGKTN